MSLPTVTQTWSYSFNNRFTYGSSSTITNLMGAFMFSLIGVGGFLPSTMGYTVKGSSNGSTGAMDGTNRITSAAAWATSANSSSAAIAWIVLTDGAGVDWCFSYNTASTDICRLSHSQGGNYIAAATATFQPTATDECFDAASGTWVNSTTSDDRVWHFWGGSDKKMWRSTVYRQGVLAGMLSAEKFTSALTSPATFTEAVGSGTVGAVKGYITTGTRSGWMALYGASSPGALGRVHANGADVNAQGFMGGELPAAAANVWNQERPALQGALGDTIFPTQLYAQTANADGKFGSLIDHWYVVTNSTAVPAAGDVFGSLQFFCVTGGGPLLPSDGATTVLVY